MSEPVKPPQRTRRAKKAQATHRRIVEAATRLFLDRGYVPTTIDAIAQAADVAVETVYARFRTKPNLMIAVKDAAVTEAGKVPLDQRPELARLASETDQARQVQIAAELSRHMLERISPVYAILREAAAADEALREHLAAEVKRRRDFQRTLVDLIHARGPLRAGLTPEQAGDTYAALASPETYLLLSIHHGWTADQFEHWLGDSLRVLLLEPDTGPRHVEPQTTRSTGERSGWG